MYRLESCPRRSPGWIRHRQRRRLRWQTLPSMPTFETAVFREENHYFFAPHPHPPRGLFGASPGGRG